MTAKAKQIGSIGETSTLEDRALWHMSKYMADAGESMDLLEENVAIVRVLLGSVREQYFPGLPDDVFIIRLLKSRAH
jgi:hypothetical protein